MIKKLLPKSTFARAVSVLVGGTAGAQALMILASPLLTRLYNPDDFGVLAVYSGLLALFAVVASLRYEIAIPLPESDIDAANLVMLSLLVVLFMTSISAVIVLAYGKDIALALDTPQLADYFWLLPLGVLLTGFYNIFSFWSVRTKKFGNIATTRISQTIITLAVQIMGHRFGGGVLIFGQVGGLGVASISLGYSSFMQGIFTKCSWSGVICVAKRYRQFPIFSTWSGLFNTAGTQLPPLMFAAFFNTGAAGLYALAHRVLAMPMAIVGDAIGKVFFSNAADAHRDGKLGSLVENVHLKLSEIAMPIALLLIIAAPDLFVFIFGSDWRVAGEFARYMAPWLYMVFVTSPLSTLFSVFERERLGMLFQGGLFVARLLSIFLGAYWLQALMPTIILFSTVSAIFWLAFLGWVSFVSGCGIISTMKRTVKVAGKSSYCVVPFLMLRIINPEEGSWFYYALFATSSLLALYYFLLFRKAYTRC
ncbi:lipopolysaccharide biosynthesis protein [Thalassolituus hydrocarboniclasticus]|uniref:Oligosaccharide flippase family protein n=1 Tax=Thalassolituus hydrocarboniclasticus TaxID=2742796 RepID=A0ABY6ADP1_9GAMM|nr:oligosaccharide flippase family protein [Thalassolituus hydrocarboniclasticus]UXD87955.1 oligosaccharide flippase family protein [Thalassolituus hydrocarboniclasticus]